MLLPPSSYNFSAWVGLYGVPLYVGLLTTGVVLLHHKYIYSTKVQIIEKSWPIHYKKGPSNFIDMGPWAHTLLFLGNTLDMLMADLTCEWQIWHVNGRFDMWIVDLTFEL